MARCDLSQTCLRNEFCGAAPCTSEQRNDDYVARLRRTDGEVAGERRVVEAGVDHFQRRAEVLRGGRHADLQRGWGVGLRRLDDAQVPKLDGAAGGAAVDAVRRVAGRVRAKGPASTR